MSAWSLVVEGHQQAKLKIRARRKEVRKTVRTGVKEAAEIVRNEGRATTEFTDRKKKLRKAIRAKKEKDRRGFVSYKVGPDPKKAPHGHLVEKGHKLFTSKKGGHRRIGAVKGRPFMRAAFEAKKQQAKRAIETAIQAALR